MWMMPRTDDLREVVRAGTSNLILCSPFISRSGLSVVEDAMPPSLNHIDIWTRLKTEDWLTGASHPDGLLEFIDSFCSAGGKSVTLRASNLLHAKIVLSDGPLGLAGSANLTGGGYHSNLELIRRVSGPELIQLKEVAESLRPLLDAIPMDSFRVFVQQCLNKIEAQEALFDLVRDEMPPADLAPRPLVPYRQYLDRLRDSPGALDHEILDIALNVDGNNNGGKVKHAFYGVQRFLQEYPQYVVFVAALPPDRWFDIAGSHMEADWKRFLHDFEAEESTAYQYSMQTLIDKYLTPASGGRQRGGGGGTNELKRVWPSVGRLMLGLHTPG